VRALRVTALVLLLSTTLLETPVAQAQIVTSGVGVCHLCGHSELDRSRYVNSFLNQLFFPNSTVRRASIAGSLYLFTATFTMYGRLSPDPLYASVTIAITAEVKNAIPTGKYRVTVTTPSGETTTAIYAIGAERFSVRHPYAPGAIGDNARQTVGSGSKGGGGPGSAGYSGPPATGGSTAGVGRSGRPAKCSRSRIESRRNETIVWCSSD
jgi:hypothetical protein